ncbi:DUF2167 domain-containing protein [Noviherbaspirillum massiliense]|uniref:DUF2167 domain-containing protein n=1 Tax=Noviherbaspirillum massiliense TaxID=1465823 RepID=UPI0002E03399|nr:DUF2167 domain-containing protein [Noviherbaspirillum massiliense]
MPFPRTFLLSVMFAAMTATVPVLAQDNAAPSVNADSASQAGKDGEKKAGRLNWQEGPRDITLLEQAVLKLPQNYAYLEGEEARDLLRKFGNPHVDDVMGLVVGPDGNWFTTVRFEKAGYIKDDDAKDWKADELFESIKEGTEASNSFRREQGIPEMEIVGWVEKPHYDAAAHRLVWAISSKDKGSTSSADQGINYNTYALGREGYFSLNLVTGLNEIEQHKPHALKLLSALEYREGKAYKDFNASTDNVAAYGLTALIAGAAAKKVGLLAVAAAFFAKFAKVIILAGAGAFAFLGKFFKRKKDATAPVAVAASDQQPGSSS